MAKPRTAGHQSTFLRYGFEWSTGADPLQIEFECIRRFGKWTFRDRQCGNGLAFHAKQAMKMLWPHLYWHRWSDLMIDQFLHSPGRTACFGPSSCVTGETRLENPLTGKATPIRFLYENRIAPVVMTMNGPRQAEVPFLKGIAPIYEVTMESGAKFRCTADHRVMLASGRYVHVSSLRPGELLQGYVVSRPQTISGIYQSIHGVNALSSPKTIAGSRFDYRLAYRFCGEPLRSEGDSDQDVSPSPIGAPKHNPCVSCDEGDRQPSHKHNQGDLLFCRLSNYHDVLADSISRTFYESHCALKIPESESSRNPPAALSQLGIHSGPPPISELRNGAAHTHYHDVEQSYSCDHHFSVRPDVMSSIRRSGTEEFYDLHVPIEHHYFAEGTVHHNSQKSQHFSLAALTMFYARPRGTTVLISSTTRDALTRRIWGYIVAADKLARSRFPDLPGSLIESKLMLLADPSTEEGRSFKDGVVGIACRSGGQWQGLQEYVGLKNDVVIAIADEGHFMPSGFLDSLINLESNDHCYAAIMGNLPDIHNPLGQAAEPKIGWDALPDTDKSRTWETRWKNGRAIQLIGMDSPNLDYPEGQEPFKGLIGRRYIEQCAENYGRESDKFNMFASGKIPRSSMDRTVFTKAQCMKSNVMERVVWGHEKLVRGYGLDAAYSGLGGDRTVGWPWIFGKDVTGQWRFCLGTPKIYPGSSSPKWTHSEAIALEARAACEEHGIPPEHFFYDGTGRSELTSALARLWSPAVVPVEFGGPATDRIGFTGERHFGEKDPTKEGRPKTCREMYDRFVTELWFAYRECIFSDQMRGMTEELIEEGSQRKWELVRGAKYCIETKDDMKERGLRSPDLTDGAVTGLEGARRLGFPLGKLAKTKSSAQNGWFAALNEQTWTTIKKESLLAA